MLKWLRLVLWIPHMWLALMHLRPFLWRMSMKPVPTSVRLMFWRLSLRPASSRARLAIAILNLRPVSLGAWHVPRILRRRPAPLSLWFTPLILCLRPMLVHVWIAHLTLCLRRALSLKEGPWQPKIKPRHLQMRPMGTNTWPTVQVPKPSTSLQLSGSLFHPKVIYEWPHSHQPATTEFYSLSLQGWGGDFEALTIIKQRSLSQFSSRAERASKQKEECTAHRSALLLPETNQSDVHWILM